MKKLKSKIIFKTISLKLEIEITSIEIRGLKLYILYLIRILSKKIKLRLYGLRDFRLK